MSVSLATGGLFNTCCGGQFGGAMGGLPSSQVENKEDFILVKILRVYFESIEKNEQAASIRILGGIKID